MKLPDYIGIKKYKESKFEISAFEDPCPIPKFTTTVVDEEAVLDTIERLIQKGYTFKVVRIQQLVFEYEDENGNMKEI